MKHSRTFSRIISKWMPLNLLCLLFIFGGCKKEEQESESQANRAPGEFTVTTSPDLNSVLISWTSSIDPDGDEVSYMVILEDDTVLQGSSQTFHEIVSLEYETDYSGSVIASDPEGLTLKKTFSFTTGVYPNQDPMAFNLLSPVSGSMGITAPITFTWEDAIDPDGDVVSYEFIIDESPEPNTSVETNISATNYVHDGTNLEDGITYYWKVIAHDGQGGETHSPLGSITMNNNMTLGVDEPGWIARYGHTTTVFNGKIWLIGGEGPGGTHYQDIWSSTDGISWTEEMAMAPWGTRSRHGAVVFDDKLWVVGGQSWYSAGSELADVWYTEDGVNWTEATADGGYGARNQHGLLAFNDKLWIVGGTDVPNTPELSESVWSSMDGINWVLETSSTYFSPAGRCLVFDNKMWFLGAFENFVRWSEDGVTWNDTDIGDAYGARIYPTVSVHDGKMWLISGSDNLISSTNELPDIWSSINGTTWELVSENAGFDPVAFGQSVSFENKLWLIGGGGGFGNNWVTNDVWYFE